MARKPFFADGCKFSICDCCGDLNISFLDVNGDERAIFGSTVEMITEAIKQAVNDPKNAYEIAPKPPTDAAVPAPSGVRH